MDGTYTGDEHPPSQDVIDFLTQASDAMSTVVENMYLVEELVSKAAEHERLNIARDLHDTMLQSFQGALLRFQSVANVLTRPDEARERLERALDQAEAAITEGRNAVQGLRASAVTVNDLANGIAAIGTELTSDPAAGPAPVIDVDVEGASRDLNPLVRDEAFRRPARVPPHGGIRANAQAQIVHAMVGHGDVGV
jgi:signal transduction histidine kinase